MRNLSELFSFNSEVYIIEINVKISYRTSGKLFINKFITIVIYLTLVNSKVTLIFQISLFSFPFRKFINIPIINFARQGDTSKINNSNKGAIFSKLWERQYSLIIFWRESN